MSEEKDRGEEAYKGQHTQHQIVLGGNDKLSYEAIADWTLLRKREKPIARIFHVAYLAKNRKRTPRPITFVFNGGPGAASAYLHVGALGPRRVVFNEDGSLPPPPVQLVDNRESWLRFTDLVFVDPVGTGFSRTIVDEKKEDDKKDGANEEENTEFWEVERDLESLGEFMQKFLSRHQRWTAPVFIAGESYGGFRVAKLARLLQERYGIGLNGSILISPAIEFASILGSDYDLMHWVELLPSLAGTAFQHGRGQGKNLAECLRHSEDFAQGDYLSLLARGESMPAQQRLRIARRAAQLIGLDEELVIRSGGRVPRNVFARELLRKERRYCGLYDASLTAVDPFPDRISYEGPDPTLAAIDRIFRAGINAQLRQNLGIETELEYELLSYEAGRHWKTKGARFIRQQVGAMDDLRYGMVLNPHMQVSISHGHFDLVTPYFSSNRLVQHMKLDESLKGNLHIGHYNGGHMFYSWAASRKAFAHDIEKLYKGTV
jgi:carboxypeptidase C (cathepsin A)